MQNARIIIHSPHRSINHPDAHARDIEPHPVISPTEVQLVSPQDLHDQGGKAPREVEEAKSSDDDVPPAPPAPEAALLPEAIQTSCRPCPHWPFMPRFLSRPIVTPTVFSCMRIDTIPPTDHTGTKSSAAHALALLMTWHTRQLHSKQFMYYTQRLLTASVDLDAGASLTDGIMALQRYGACLEEDSGFDAAKLLVRPSAACFDQAAVYRVHSALTLNNNLRQIQDGLLTHGPVACRIGLPPSFATDRAHGKTSVDTQGPSVAVALVGWDNQIECFLARFSMGPDIGYANTLLIPFDQILNHASEFWVICEVSQAHEDIPVPVPDEPAPSRWTCCWGAEPPTTP